MGCEACRQKEPEANFPFENNDLEKNPEEKDIFITTLENNLQTFGQYYPSDISTLISKPIQDYIDENPIQIDEQYCKDLNGQDVKPIEFKNGNVYQGGWNKTLRMEGQGKYFIKDNNIYVEGIWKNGDLLYARIFISSEDSFDIYQGEIKDSNFNGKGKYIESNGKIYEGDFINGEKNGTGKINYKDGTIYEGQVEKGELKGEGKMIWTNGYEYIGGFDGNKLEGKGKLKGPNNETYEGDFSNNLFSGKGIYTFENGNVYEGQFEYGIKKGKGIYKSLNIFEYDGDWDNDQPCGIGKLSSWNKNGIIKSSWRYGKIMEEPCYEKGTQNDFEGINFNIVIDEMKLNIKDLSNLVNSEIQTTQYRPGSEPSFLDD